MQQRRFIVIAGLLGLVGVSVYLATIVNFIQPGEAQEL